MIGELFGTLERVSAFKGICSPRIDEVDPCTELNQSGTSTYRDCGSVEPCRSRSIGKGNLISPVCWPRSSGLLHTGKCTGPLVAVRCGKNLMSMSPTIIFGLSSLSPSVIITASCIAVRRARCPFSKIGASSVDD